MTRSGDRRVVAATWGVGTAVLGASLTTRPGSGRFYALTLAAAGTWVGGAVLAGRGRPPRSATGTGPRHHRHADRPPGRTLVVPVLTGVGTAAVFCAGAVLVRRLPVLDGAVAGALEFAERGSGPLVLLTTCANGVGEEVFFRGALYDALGPARPVLASTVAYTATTVGTRNPALVLAAAVMGTLFGMQRRATGGVAAPLLTHLTWSVLMVRLLPRVLRWRRHRRAHPLSTPT